MTEDYFAKNGITTHTHASGRQARVMALCYGLGVFNDNFFKQAALLLAATAGLAAFQGWATFLFAAPFVLFSAGAGWIADRYSKKTVIIWAKLLEVLAMAAGAWGMITLQWGWLLGMVFTMGLNSTLFCPALNGSIPELFAEKEVPRINAMFKLATTGAILAGIALSGVALDGFGLIGSGLDAGMSEALFGQMLVGGIALLVAVLGFGASFFLKGLPGAGGDAPFPLSGPLDSFRDLLVLRRKDPALLLSMGGDAFFCFLSTLVVLLITNLGVQELELSYTLTSMLFVALLTGICAGSLIAARGTSWSWRCWTVPALSLIGVLLMCLPLILYLPETLHGPLLFSLYFIIGICGGVFLIPMTSFVQVRPVPSERGKMLGASYCFSFTAILLAGQVYPLLAFAAPSTGHAIVGVGTLIAAWMFARIIQRLPLSEADRLAASPPGTPCRQGACKEGACKDGACWWERGVLACVRGILGLRYRVRVDGLEAVRQDSKPGQGTLFLANHPALVDPLLVYTALAPDFMPRPLADKGQLDRPVVRKVTGLAHPVLIPDLNAGGKSTRAALRDGVIAGLNAVVEALRAGENVLLYPAGGLSRDGYERLGNNGGVRYILQAVPQARVVLVRTSGLWGSSFGWADGYAPNMSTCIRRGVLNVLRYGLFFMPRRLVHIALHQDAEVAVLAAEKNACALNRRLEAFYNEGLHKKSEAGTECPPTAATETPSVQESSETGASRGTV